MAPSSSSSTVEEQPPKHQVFINYVREKEISGGFVSHLVTALKSNNINVFIDIDEYRGEHKDKLFKRIEESRIALAIFSTTYTNSIWCLRELAKIKDCEDEHKLVAIPIFYKLDESTVKYLKGDFGDNFRGLPKHYDERVKKKWEEALIAMPELMGIEVPHKSDESEKIKNIVEEVKKVLNKIPSNGSQKASADPSENIDTGTSAGGEKDKTFGIKQRLTELGDKLDLQKYKGTRFIGVVGMPGIGKTTLLKELYRTWKLKFSKHKFIDQSHLKSDNFGKYSLATELLEKPAPKLKNGQIDDSQKLHNAHNGLVSTEKVLVVLDDVSRREQIDALLGKCEWIKDGSRIVIATNDMSLIEDLDHLVNDTYVVRQLNHRDSLQLFCYHAFDDDQANPLKEDFMKVSEDFLQYAKGHPRALKILGRELHGKRMKHWEDKLKLLAQNPSTYIGMVLQVCYKELSPEQKNAFLDIGCFRSEDVDYVESLLASADPRSAEATSAVKALTNKFLINTCEGQVEMHDLLYKFSRKLDQDGSSQRRLWLHKDIITEDGAINILRNTVEPANVRGIFLDLNEVEEVSLQYNHFREMTNLRYLKFYNSHCPSECETNNKINMIDGLELPLKEVRCLHWLKFPLKELPDDFDPTNLVDLRLPYSKIEQLWNGVKDTQRLKWVDLNHSIKLSTLSGLSQAQSLRRLNLEGCTALGTSLYDIAEMKSLAFLNLKECTSLESLPEMNLISLKTLILSGCSEFKEFPFISENIEALYLERTAISQIPDNVVKLKKLILLNMKDCQRLKTISTCVGELEALQKLVLSGCSKLLDFPEIKKSSISILLLDGTSIKTMPQLSSVQYLCLSRNDQISCLPAGINQLSQLTWLDFKCCKSLTSIPELPPNLQYLDAHGCSSLKTVAKPLARIKPTTQNRCTFNFTNCDNLEQAAKEEITSYAQRKCQLLSDALKHYNEGLSSEALFSTCFPGCELPSWVCYKAVGSLLQCKLNPHWHDKRLSGISLCAVVSFPNCKDQISCFSVACTFTIKAADKSWIPFTSPVGSWTLEGVKKDDKIESDHVFIAYITCPHTIRCLDDENSDKCNFTEASLEFTVTGGTSVKGKFTVLSCGLSLVYAKDRIDNNSLEEKYGMPVKVSIQEPQHGVLEEQINLINQEFIIDDQRKCEQTEGVKLSSVGQTCGVSVAPRIENLQANG